MVWLGRGKVMLPNVKSSTKKLARLILNYEKYSSKKQKPIQWLIDDCASGTITFPCIEIYLSRVSELLALKFLGQKEWE